MLFFTGFLFSLKFFLDQFFIKTFSSFIYFGTGNYMPDIKKIQNVINPAFKFHLEIVIVNINT